ncbi:MAG: hypothetical protein FJZ64_02540 [Chlamydiae bacterium]|nr:hypothetical protein [Chlamydiota bacterium]
MKGYFCATSFFVVQVFSIHADFLFWRAQEGALDYALSMTQTAPTPCWAEGNFETATFNGAPGFRVGGSFFRAPKYWEVWGLYTRLTDRGSNSAIRPGLANVFLTGTWPQIFSSPIATATSDIHLNYNVTDLFVTRVFLPNPHLRLRVLGGVTVAWINQFWKIQYNDGTGFYTKVGNRWDFTGAGLRIGTMFDWYWFQNIYLTGGTTIAGLAGSYNNSARQLSNFTGYNPTIPLRNAYYSDARGVVTGQFYLGPSYQKNFTNLRFEVFAGYEWNGWFNLQEMYRSTSGNPDAAKETWMSTSLLLLQGLTARVTLDF